MFLIIEDQNFTRNQNTLANLYITIHIHKNIVLNSHFLKNTANLRLAMGKYKNICIFSQQLVVIICKWMRKGHFVQQFAVIKWLKSVSQSKFSTNILWRSQKLCLTVLKTQRTCWLPESPMVFGNSSPMISIKIHIAMQCQQSPVFLHTTKQTIPMAFYFVRKKACFISKLDPQCHLFDCGSACHSLFWRRLWQNVPLSWKTCTSFSTTANWELIKLLQQLSKSHDAWMVTLPDINLKNIFLPLMRQKKFVKKGEHVSSKEFITIDAICQSTNSEHAFNAHKNNLESWEFSCFSAKRISSHHSIDQCHGTKTWTWLSQSSQENVFIPFRNFKSWCLWSVLHSMAYSGHVEDFYR